MPNSDDILTQYQCQVLSDLCIDAWYLKPLSKMELDDDYQTSQQEISHIIEELVPSSFEQEYNHRNVEQPIEQSTNMVDDVKMPEKEIPQIAPKKIQVITSSSDTVRIDENIDLTPPIDNIIKFPQLSEIIENDFSSIQVSIDTLQNGDTLSGVGSRKPQWLIIIPPPTSSHVQSKKLFNKSEQQLFDEILSAISKNWNDVYVTPLIKQATYKNQDPDDTLINTNLPILQAEISCLKPQRIILMGRIPNHTVLSTKAPLSQLMSEDYILQLEDSNYPLTVLPSLHYFLAIPSEKKLLWQQLKKLF